MGNRIEVIGLVAIRNGKIYYKDLRNHFVDAGLKGLLSQIIMKQSTGQSNSRFWANSWSMYLGSDTSTPTSTTMTELAVPIGTAPGTPPDTKSVSAKDGTTDGIWEAQYHATWYAGTLPATTLGEMALYLRAFSNTIFDTFRWVTTPGDTTNPVVMVSRLSSADGDFSSFIIDNTKPLTVDWTVRFSFV